ncbi:MAG: sulfatase-like hydrolase/transferase [Puniceicoccaceae bacterium]
MKDRNIFLLVCFILGSIAPVFANKPNVLLIYTDDHRYTGVHALGGQELRTPHLDRLAGEGIAFTRTYLQGSFSGATCIPSRACLLSGRSLFQLKALGRNMPEEHVTIGEAFQRAGYHSHIVGKWHQDNASLARSFDSGEKIMGRGVYLTDHFRMPYWDWDPSGKFSKEDAYLLEYNPEREFMIDPRPLTKDDKRGPTGTEKDGPHSSEVFAYNAKEFISNYDSEKPFFMYLAFHAPHDPRHVPQAYKDMYPEDEIELTPSYMPQHPFDNGHMVLRDEKLAPWPRTPAIARKELSDYYAIITHLDEQIGRVIQSLKDSGQWENTIVVMAGDSGLAVGNHGLLGKQSVYDEDGLHVPFILSGGPVQDKGLRVDALAYIHDIYPTICELAGIDTPESVKGKSLVPVLKGEVDEIREYTYHAYMQYQRAYRIGDYKLIEYVRGPGANKNLPEQLNGSRVTQLFNYKKDPWEIHNLAVFPEYWKLVDEMREEMKVIAETEDDNKEAVDYGWDFWDYYN